MKKILFNGYSLNSCNLYSIIDIEDNTNDSFYYVSNDVIDNINENNELDKKYVMLGVANIHFFHCLANCLEKGYDFKRIIAIDYSKQQVNHAFNTIKLIIRSSNRVEFIEKFYKIKIGKKAREILNCFPQSERGKTRGGIEIGMCPYKEIEEQFWGSVNFSDDVKKDVLSKKWELNKNGIVTYDSTIGDIDKKYLTIYSCNRQDYDAWPFTISWNSGFLRSEEIFSALKSLLSTVEMYVIHGDITNCFDDIILTNRYESIVFWSSNIFHDYFINKHKMLGIMLNHINDISLQNKLPEIDIYHLYDQRVGELKHINFRKKYSLHTESFKKVSDYMAGTAQCLEVVNLMHWIAEDKGVSKLPNTEYVLFDDFSKKEDLHPLNIDCIFFHILMGHGVSLTDFEVAFHKAKSFNVRIVILEHNKLSKDFNKEKNIFVDLNLIRGLCGKEKKYSYCHGLKDNYRNIILEY